MVVKTSSRSNSSSSKRKLDAAGDATSSTTKSSSSEASNDKKKNNKKVKTTTSSVKKKETQAESVLSTLTSHGVDVQLVERAVQALLKYHEHQQEQQKEKAKTEGEAPKKEPLFGTDEVAIYVQLGLDVPPSQPRVKPHRLMIPHPLYKIHRDDNDNDKSKNDDEILDEFLEEAEVCLIVKEESKPWIQDMITKFPKHMECIKKVLGLESLRKKHATFAQRRQLLSRFTVFMADDRILPMLTQALGKTFIQAKKQPIPVAVRRKEALPFAIQKALSATYLILPAGDCVSVRVGHVHMTPQALVDNVVAICNQAPDRVPRKWANIRSMSIKTPISMALPVYNKTPEQLQDIARMAGLESVWKRPAGAEKHNDDDDEAKNDKKRMVKAAKSPLLQALKKTLKEQEAATDTSNTESSSSPSKKMKLSTEDKQDHDDDNEEEKKNKQTTKKAKKQTTADSAPKASASDDAKDAGTKSEKKTSKKTKMERSSTGSDEKNVNEKNVKAAPESDEPAHENKKESTKTSAKEKKEISVASPKEDEQETESTPKAKEAKKKHKEESSSSASSKKKTKEESKAAASAAAKGKDEDDNNKAEKSSFVAAKKFKGSKKGYKFQQGPKGLGYYLDVPPVVDKMALEALARSRGRSSSNASKRSRSHSSGKRRGRK